MLMFEDDSDSEGTTKKKQVTDAPRRRKKKKIKIPRRAPSVVVPGREIIINRLPDEDAPFEHPKKLRQCLKVPLSLYELAAAAVDKLDYPEPFEWTVDQVADWMENVVGLPEYRACIVDNHINGKRLLRLADPSVPAKINIHNFEHIKIITENIRRVFRTDYLLFARSLSLPLRKPLTYCTWFKSRTGPAWGIRQNWTRSDVLRWMKIIKPKPMCLDHWDRVWYEEPDFPKTMLARIPKADLPDTIVRYEPVVDICNEYLTPRRFRIMVDIPDEDQFIWMEHLPGSPSRKEPKKERKVKVKLPRGSRLIPQKTNLAGLSGKDLIMARRKMPKPKFLKK